MKAYAIDELVLEQGEILAPELHSNTLEDTAGALAAVGSGHVRGKVVVVP
jgi:hypothetical protein